MKKIKLITILMILMLVFIPVVGLASDMATGPGWMKPSGSKTSSTLIMTGTGVFQGIAVATDGTNAVTVDIYDAITATSTKLIPTWTVTSSSTDRAQSFFSPFPIFFATGLYVNVSVAGSGTVAFVVYYNDMTYYSR